MNAIRAALGAGAIEALEPPRSIARPPVAPVTLLRVLIAEDSTVNQMLAVRLLEKRGHIAVIADNGLKALAALEREEFDLVLMDVQMPEMNGFEATAAIRKKEQTTGGHIPIVAMTAHAMKGDEDRCLSAGMDGYVSKPITPDELFLAISKVVRDGAKPQPDHALFDRSAILVRVDGDTKRLVELVDVFLDTDYTSSASS